MNATSASAFSIKNNLFLIKKNLTDFKSEKYYFSLRIKK